MDNVKDTEATRVLPHMIPVLLDCLRSGEPSYQKESLEYGFRKAIIETLHRIPMADSIRPQAHAFIAGMLHIVRTDNEENAIIGCKTLVELSRCFRPLSDELLKDFFSNFHERCNSLPNLIELTLSEDSAALDPNQIIPSTQSFKVFYEICSLLVAMLQVSRQTILPIIQEHLKTYFQIVGLESSAQRAARENFESMGDYWTGMAPTIRNPQTYADFIQAQIKVRRHAYSLNYSNQRYYSSCISSSSSHVGLLRHMNKRQKRLFSLRSAYSRIVLPMQYSLVRYVPRNNNL